MKSSTVWRSSSELTPQAYMTGIGFVEPEEVFQRHDSRRQALASRAQRE
jgi:hypothetical protein